MLIQIKSSLLWFVNTEYHDTFDEWYSAYIPALTNPKYLNKNRTLCEVELPEEGIKWLNFVIKDDSDPMGRLLDTFDERTPSEKRAITKFIKEAKEYLKTV